LRPAKLKPELDAIISRAGREAWENACRLAWRTAPRTGRQNHPRVAMPDFVHSVADWICEEMSLAPVDRIALLFAVYERMPCYALLLVGPLQCAEGCPQALALWQAKVRELLAAEEDALADPVGYWLWCGPFEDINEAEPWWRALTAPGGPPRLFERLLEHSGPVPYALKAELYERLLPDERWRPFILRSLDNSSADLFGQIDWADAERVKRRLRSS